MRAITTAYVLASAMVLTACGSGNGGGDGDDGSGAERGRFLDAAVSNLSYATATKSGKTNTKGEFEYEPGETVTFSIGETELPPIGASAIITPLDMGATGQVNDPVVSNILVLLQSLDSDNDPSNGISISDAAKSASAPIDFNQSTDDFIADPSVINLVNNGGQKSPGFVSLADARSHFQATLGGLEGQYVVTNYEVTYTNTGQSVTACRELATVPATHEFTVIESTDVWGDLNHSCSGNGVSECVAWDLDDKGIYYTYGEYKVLEMLDDGSGTLTGRWIIQLPASVGGGTTDCGPATASPVIASE